MRTSTGRGFTLVELLVVITIMGILVALLFPALNASRESARRATCSQKLTKINVALQRYQDANCVYPSGTINPEGPIHNRAEGNHLGWMVQILPYLDEKAAYNHVDTTVGVYDAQNAQVRALYIPTFVCPSAISLSPPNIAVSSYAGCHNDVEAPIDADNHGVFFLNSKISPKDIPDGLTHTIFVGEKLSGLADLGWMSGTRATLRNGGSIVNTTPVSDGNTNNTETSDLWVGGFGSHHILGSHFLFGDGGVRFVDNAIDLRVLKALCHRADGEILNEGPTREGL